MTEPNIRLGLPGFEPGPAGYFTNPYFQILIIALEAQTYEYISGAYCAARLRHNPQNYT